MAKRKEIMSLKSKDGNVHYTLTPTELKLGFTKKEMNHINKALKKTYKMIMPVLDCEIAVNRYFEHLKTVGLDEVQSAKVTSDGRVVIKYANGTTNKKDTLTVNLSGGYKGYSFSPAQPKFFNVQQARKFVDALNTARENLNVFLSEYY